MGIWPISCKYYINVIFPEFVNCAVIMLKNVLELRKCILNYQYKTGKGHDAFNICSNGSQIIVCVCVHTYATFSCVCVWHVYVRLCVEGWQRVELIEH